MDNSILMTIILKLLKEHDSIESVNIEDRELLVEDEDGDLHAVLVEDM